MNKALSLFKAHDKCLGETPKLTVVFIHGLAADSSSFMKAIDYLEGTRSMRDVRFVAFDLLGAGGSLSTDELDYTFAEQLTALENSIRDLKVKTPLILVGHSMGTFIATRYADAHRREVSELILVSPPIYRVEDIENPLFQKALDGFREAVKMKNSKILSTKAFNNSLENIVMNKKNYDILAKLNKKTTLIYGELDKIIGSHNIAKLLKENPNIKAIKTAGTHGVSRDKYIKILEILDGVLNENL